MIKPLLILFNTVSVFFFSFFFGDAPVSVTGNFPKSAPVGSEFTAEITVKKTNVSGFAKLQLEVPQGFTVKEVDSKTGNFSFAGTIAKIIWTSVPSEEQFTVKFALVADASAAGPKTIGSKFSYVSNNSKEMVEMTPAEIQIGEASSEPVATSEPAPTTTTTEATQPVTTTQPVPTPATTDPQTAPVSSGSEPLSDVVCARTITKGAAGEYNVDVKIKKPGIKGFAKFQEILPAGYNARQGKTNGSSFSVSDGKAKFVWVSLPAEDELLISYTLVKEGTENQDARMEGEFSYLENDQTKKIKLPFDVISATGDVIAATGPAGNNARQSTTPTPTESAPTTNVTPTPTTAVASSEPKTTTSSDPASTPNAVVAKKEGNVSYVVQIGAFRNAIQSDVLSKKFNISETIKSEMADGYSKFMVGSYGEYKQARDHRENIRQKGCNSAFVAAYNGPKRITVQEALMISSQKWYK